MQLRQLLHIVLKIYVHEMASDAELDGPARPTVVAKPALQLPAGSTSLALPKSTSWKSPTSPLTFAWSK